MNKFILGVLFFLSQKNEASINCLITGVAQIRKINVAVIDTGIDINHPDLKNYIWTNSGEIGKDSLGHDKATNGIDDDRNGFVDDVHGWNFINNSNDVSDEQGHGTHISGIIKEEFIKLIDPNQNSQIRLMALKYYSSAATDTENLINSTRAIEYANRMNVNIINYSGGGAKLFSREIEAIRRSSKMRILFVAAAGNNNTNNDIFKFYPASYGLANMITVAATNKSGDLMSFSNYGGASIDIAAPGQKILSTLPNNSYGFLSGTSQATAFITGHVAFLLSQQSQQVSADKIILQMKLAGQTKKSLIGKIRSQVALLDSK